VCGSGGSKGGDRGVGGRGKGLRRRGGEEIILFNRGRNSVGRVQPCQGCDVQRLVPVLLYQKTVLFSLISLRFGGCIFFCTGK